MASTIVSAAELAMSRQDYAAAARLFAQALEVSPDQNPRAFFNYAICLVKARRYREAATAYRQFLKLRPDEQTQQFLGFIKCLETAGEMSADSAEQLVEMHFRDMRAQQEATRIAGRTVILPEVLAAWASTMDKTSRVPVNPFRGITGSNPTRVPLLAFGADLFHGIDPYDVFRLCDEMQRAGANLAVVLGILDGLEPAEPSELGPRKGWTLADLSARSPWNWYFVQTALDNVVAAVTNKAIADFPTLRSHRERLEPDVAREFVHEGFSYGLEAYGL